MNRIFLSYRREDSADVSGRINDRLAQHFGQSAIFTDVDSIPLGVDFQQYIDEQVGKCDIFLAVIGRDWLSVTDTDGRPRLQQPGDFVRIEVESALQRNIPVIPLLVRRATMPSADDLPAALKKLAARNGTPIRPNPDFHRDMERLISGIEQHLSRQSEAAAKRKAEEEERQQSEREKKRKAKEKVERLEQERRDREASTRAAEEHRPKAEQEQRRLEYEKRRLAGEKRRLEEERQHAEAEHLQPERQQRSGISNYKALGFIPVLLMLTYATPTLGGGFFFSFPLAFVPLAVFLGHRYGSAGLITVALGGALLPLGFAGAFGLFGGQLAIYILSLWLCAIFASGKDIKEVLSKSDIFQNPSVIAGVLFASLMFLPITFRYSAELDSGLVTRFHFRAEYILYFVLWYLGTQNVNRRMVIVFLFCFAFFGFLLRHFEFIPISYSLNSPGDVLVGAFFFIAGEYTRKLLDNQAGIQEVPRLVKGIIVACMVLYGAAFIDRLIENIVDIRYLYLTGGPSYLVVMSFLLGTYYGRRGIIFSGVCIFVFETVSGVIRGAYPDIAYMYMTYGGNLGIWITGVAYALLGKGFVDRIRIESRQATTSTQE